MVRPFRPRRIWNQPNATFFKPAGIRMAELQETNLTYDEVEAIRHNDYEGLDQKESAKKMNISQPTLGRILKSARSKISDALINGKAIRIEGGVYQIAQPKRGMRFGAPSSCKCPNCGHMEPKQRAVPCSTITCPKCNTLMTRGE